MEYLPSKKFLIRVVVIILLIGGWFFFSSNVASRITSTDGTLEDNNGVIVFSRNKTSISPKLDTAEDWDISSESYDYFRNEEGAIIKIPTTTAKNSFNPVSASILNITTDSTTESFKKYAQDLVTALKPYSFDGLPNEGFLTMSALEKENTEELKKVSVMAELHKVVGETLLRINVPAEIASRHLSLINNILKISYLDVIMSEAFERPDEVMNAVNGFKTETIAFIDSITRIDNFFKEKGISFSKDQKIQIYINSIE